MLANITNDRVIEAAIRLQVAKLKQLAAHTTLQYWKLDGNILSDELRAEAAELRRS
jgi:hypothetical protein